VQVKQTLIPPLQAGKEAFKQSLNMNILAEMKTSDPIMD